VRVIRKTYTSHENTANFYVALLTVTIITFKVFRIVTCVSVDNLIRGRNNDPAYENISHLNFILLKHFFIIIHVYEFHTRTSVALVDVTAIKGRMAKQNHVKMLHISKIIFHRV
jgi:hypothetical protein